MILSLCLLAQNCGLRMQNQGKYNQNPVTHLLDDDWMLTIIKYYYREIYNIVLQIVHFDDQSDFSHPANSCGQTWLSKDT